MNSVKQFVKYIFRWQAKRILKKYTPQVIVIVGGVGKTSTRDVLYSILSKKKFVRKSEKSFTAELGISHTIIGCAHITSSLSSCIENMVHGVRMIMFPQKYPDTLILEVDCDKPGDMQSVAEWLVPHVLVITALGNVPSHIELFGNMDSFAQEYAHIVNSVAGDGCIVYNRDDEQTVRLVRDTVVRTVSCGIASDADISSDTPTVLYGKASDQEIPVGMSYTINSLGTVTLFGSLGVAYVYASILASAVAIELGISRNDIRAILNRIKALPGRMNIIPGIKNTTIIDDTYNASPIAYTQSIGVLKQITHTHGRKVAIIGDMLELGKFSADAHRQLGRELAQVVSFCVCVGIRTRSTADELILGGFDASHIIRCDTSRDTSELIANVLVSGDIVLVKGSQAMRMERVVQSLLRHPQDAKKLLVRQEAIWKERE